MIHGLKRLKDVPRLPMKSQLANPHLASIRISPVLCRAIPLVGTGQRKTQDGRKQNSG